MHDVLVSVTKCYCQQCKMPFFKYVKTAIEDHELFIAVVNPSTISDITITVECFFPKSVLPIVQFLQFKKYINLLGIYLIVFSRTQVKQTLASSYRECL